MGMLLGSLIGVQVGSLVTKVVPGIQIRGFFALAVSAGFINRAFALPDKLQSLGYIKISPALGGILGTIGNSLFFLIIGAFAIWVFYAFFSNISKLKTEEPGVLINESEVSPGFSPVSKELKSEGH
jgi:hypothetical protein